MANRLFAVSKYGQTQANLMKARRPTVGTMGESHGQAYLAWAIQYSCMRHYAANIIFDNRQFTAGVGRQFAMSGTTTTGVNGLTTQITQFQTYPTDIVFIASGYNDQPNVSTAPTIAGTVQTVAGQAFAAGAKAVVIMGIPPWPGQTVAGWRTYNTMMRNWANNTNGAYFIDLDSIIADMAVATGTMAYRDIATFTQGTYRSYTVDGTHYSALAGRAIAPYIAEILKQLAPQRYPRANISPGTFDPVNAPWSEVLGDAGNCLGTAGIYLSGLDTGVAGKDSTSRLDVERSNATTTSTNSIVTGSNGERKQRMTIGGTYGSGDYVSLQAATQITNVNNSDATRLYDMECVIDLNAITGLQTIEMRPTAGTAYSTIINGSSGAPSPANNWLDATTESLFLYSLFPFPLSGNNPGFTLYHTFGGARTLAGSIDVSRMSMMRVA